MKKLFLLLAFIFGIFTVSKAQYEYTVNWADTNTYSIDCGRVVPSQWSVKNDSCNFLSPYFVVEIDEPVMVSFNFRVNQSGNGDISDRCYLWHSIDGGSWVLDTLFQAGAFPGVYPFSDSVLLGQYHYTQFKISMVTNDKTEFWAIKGGDGVVDDGDPNTNSIEYYKEIPESMPVELIDFSATINDLYVEINWSTASETNNDYFIVEKNRNLNTPNWVDVGKVFGNGTTNSVMKYWITDIEPYRGLAYYRLKQYDYDGKLTTYNPIVVNWIESENFSYIIAPNPTENKAVLLITNKSKAELSILVYDESGNLKIDGGVCKIDGDCEITIDFNALANGIYFITIKKGDKVYKNKIIKTDD